MQQRKMRKERLMREKLRKLEMRDIYKPKPARPDPKLLSLINISNLKPIERHPEHSRSPHQTARRYDKQNQRRRNRRNQLVSFDNNPEGPPATAQMPRQRCKPKFVFGNLGIRLMAVQLIRE